MAYCFDFRVGRNGHFTEDCAEAQETRGNWRPSREWFTCWPSIFQRGDFSSYLSRRVVPSINIPNVYSEKDLLIIWLTDMVFQLICWRVSYTFVLASSSRTCGKDLSEVPYFMLNGCQFGCAVLCGLVPDCGSMIVRRSSRSPHGFGVSLPVAWSHPTLADIKLFTCCSQQSYPCSWTYCREDQAILVLNHIGTYHVVIRAIIVTVGLFIIHLSIICLPSVTVFIHHIYLFCHIL